MKTGSPISGTARRTLAATLVALGALGAASCQILDRKSVV